MNSAVFGILWLCTWTFYINCFHLREGGGRGGGGGGGEEEKKKRKPNKLFWLLLNESIDVDTAKIDGNEDCPITFVGRKDNRGLVSGRRDGANTQGKKRCRRVDQW